MKTYEVRFKASNNDDGKGYLGIKTYFADSTEEVHTKIDDKYNYYRGLNYFIYDLCGNFIERNITKRNDND